MKVWVFTYCKNEEKLMPFFLRHYSTFAERIIVYDDQSVDGTRTIAKAFPKADVQGMGSPVGLNEDVLLKFSQDRYKEARGKADWVMWVDIDEFIYAPDPIALLEMYVQERYDIVDPRGFNMMCEGLPEDDGKSQIYELCDLGVSSPCYSKPVIFKPHMDMQWTRGKHQIENMGDVMRTWTSLFKLLHYRYLGFDYTRERNLRNYERCTPGKGAAWTCNPDHKGIHSPEWAREAQKEAVHILSCD